MVCGSPLGLSTCPRVWEPGSCPPACLSKPGTRSPPSHQLTFCIRLAPEGLPLLTRKGPERDLVNIKRVRGLVGGLGLCGHRQQLKEPQRRLFEVADTRYPPHDRHSKRTVSAGESVSQVCLRRAGKRHRHAALRGGAKWRCRDQRGEQMCSSASGDSPSSSRTALATGSRRWGQANTSRWRPLTARKYKHPE